MLIGELAFRSRDSYEFFRPENIFSDVSKYWKNGKEPFLSSRLTGEGLKYDTTSRTQDGIVLVFPSESLSVSSNSSRYGQFAYDQS